MQGVSEMQPFANQIGDGSSVWVLGLADGISQILKLHLKEREERAKEGIEESESKAAA